MTRGQSKLQRIEGKVFLLEDVMQEELVKEFAKEHAMSCLQVKRFNKEWDMAINGIKAAGVNLGRIKLVPKKSRR